MHLADGVLSSVPVLAGASVAGVSAVAAAARRSLSGDGEAAWTGTLAAFVLALQALNVPMLPGASAHAIGAGLLALALGPGRAIVALTAVLIIQAIALADGGITVLGINALNIAVLPVVAVYVARRTFGESRRGLMAAAVVGTLLGNLLGAVCLGTLLVAGASAPPGTTFGWLLAVQGAAGLAEGVLTALAVRALQGRAPGLLAQGVHSTRSGWGWALIATVLVVLLLPLASTQPDALELVLHRMGYR